MSTSATSPLARDIAWLNARLDEIEPAEPPVAIRRLREMAQRMLASGELQGDLPALDAQQIHFALKLLTIRFHLRNKAEQVHIARVNRRREQEATRDKPRPESLSEAISICAARGVKLDDLLATLATLDIQPTLTAHPTESRRRSVLEKQSHIGELLQDVHTPESTVTERARLTGTVRQTLSLLLATDEVRSRRLDVIDEVRNGVHYLAGPIWDAIAGLYRDLTEAITAYYGTRVELPTFVRYRSWMGGDRDGNPNVTAELTRKALAEMRDAALERHAEVLERLRRELSISEQRVPISEELLESIKHDEAERPLDPSLLRHLQHEPFRVKIRHMQLRFGEPGYSAARYLEDLLLLRRAMIHAGLREAAADGLVTDAIIHVRTFGFHLAAIDVRQHSRVHEAAVAEMLRAAGVEADYASLSETQRLETLRRELATSRPLLGRFAELSEPARQLLQTLEVIAGAVRQTPEAVGSYVISMAHDVSDVLEVLILLREVGLWRIEDGQVHGDLDVVPLFETVDDLRGAAERMQALFAEPAYAGQLAARGNFQEIMLGYSDSNKDGGYWAANWRLQCAQNELAQTCRAAGVAFRFFHGRGGTVARGGGRANRAILAAPAFSRNGRIRFTEQGEVISFRYAMPALAHRHLEQIGNAMIRGSISREDRADTPESLPGLMEQLAARSRQTYRELIDDPAFWPWFVDSSPVLHIGELPIASRPVARTSGEIQFSNLRAIPWVFAWTQMRYNAPGWFGIGSAFAELVLNDSDRLETCRAAYQAGGYFRAFTDNAQQELARGRLPVAAWYAGERGAEMHARLAAEFALAEQAVLAISGQEALLDNNRVIQQSIRERNGDTDIINALQVELLRRWREQPSDERELLRSLILLSVNALAAAMQSTG